MDRVTQPPDTRTTGQSLSQDSGYVIVSEIGRGGMGIVYRAHDLKLGRMVALKRPKPEVMALPDFSRRFLREARTASKLLHPNITTVFAAYEEDGVPWLVMELVEGVSLRDRLARGGPLPVGEVIEHAEGLADALRAAHEQGILHSDVNPNNILIGRDGRARLTDFGLARARNLPGEAPVFGAGEAPTWSAPEAAGTRGYMAPEHLRGRGLDPRSDLYCLGLVLFEMCAGSPVFAGKSTVEWVGAAMDGETERLTRLGPEVPPELRRIIARATATKPQQRYQSAAEMAADLRALRRYRESGVEIEVAAAARARKRTHYGVLAAALVLAAAGTVALLALRSRGPSVLRPRPLTSAPGWEGDPALAPDGSMVAYASDESGNAEIWVMEIGSRNAVRLTDDPAIDRSPAWFPDGRMIAYASERDGETGIWTVPLGGGRPRLFASRAQDPAPSPDGSRFAYASRDASGTLRIVVAPIADPAAASVLTGPTDGFLDHSHPNWSPDGRRICYQDFRDVWVVAVAGGPAVMLTDHQGANREPVWSSDGRYVYFSSQREGPLALWRVAATGGKPERVTMGTGPEAQPSIGLKGGTIAYETRREEQDIEVRDQNDGRSWRITSSAFEGLPTVRPDGRALVFASTRLGSIDLWSQALAAGGLEGPPRRLTDLPGSVAVPAFSPDGRWVAFHRVVNGERELWVMPSEGGAPAPLTDHPGIDVHPGFSPDGTTMAFVSDRSGGQHVWVAAFRGALPLGEPRQVTFGEGSDQAPSWSPGGERLVFIRSLGQDSDVWTVGLGDGSIRRVTNGVWVQWVRWGPTDDSVLVAANWDRRHVEVRRVSLADHSAEPIDPPVVMGQAGFQGGFDLSRDGRTLAFDIATITGDVWVADGLPDGR